MRHLRDTACGSPDCAWCAENNDPKRALERWFGFPAFRPEPVDEMGQPLQERIVAEAMAGKSVLGILPTGTGKSVCYQIPALSKFDKTGALTVVISPLVALMADQVQGLARAGISSAVTVNGMLSLPERHHALEQVRMGDAPILLIAPEQLRSVSVRSALRQREVGLWVLDEAHCISKWGHDFRPDYRYVSRFIREFSGDEPPAPVLCLTATAKPEVVRDIREHFQSRLGHPFVRPDGSAVLQREVSPDTTSLPNAGHRIIAPDPRLVDLSFAGRLRDGDLSLAAIAEAAVGDSVTLSRHGDRWLILDGRKRVLGRMAKAFIPPEDTEVIGGEISVVLQRREDDGDDAYWHLIRRYEWEVFLPELTEVIKRAS